MGEIVVIPDLFTLSLPQKIGQIFCPYFDVENFEQSRTLVEDYGVGALHVGGAYAPLLRSACDRLRPLAAVPFLVCANMEGSFQEVSGITTFPSAMSLAATDSEDMAYRVGLALGKECRAAGIDWLFVPVVDVNTNADNPVINMRSFGDDVGRVSRLGKAYVRGLKEAGIMATAKHFPGHGSTSHDSHVSGVRCGHAAKLFGQIDVAPFRELIAAGVPSIMTSHMVVPHLDKKMATFSSKILQDLLRQELHFSGVVISDALFMGAVVEKFSPMLAAKEAFLAGCDVLIVHPDNIRELFTGMLAMVESGEIPAARLDESVARILAAKKIFLGADAPAMDIFGQHNQLADEVASRAITLLQNKNALVPLSPAKLKDGLTCIIVGTGKSCEEDFEDLLHEAASKAGIVCRRAGLDSIADIPRKSLVLVAVYKTVRCWSNEIMVTTEQQKSIRKILARFPSLLVTFGSPYLAARFPEALARVTAYDSTPATTRAVVKALWGGATFSGVMPVRT